MRFVLTLAILVSLLVLGAALSTPQTTAQEPAAVRKPQDSYLLGPEAKLGPVKFSHLDHATKNRNVEGTAPIPCIHCHHTAQPAPEAVKFPPHKTAWPADRTTTLTADLFEKDPNAPPVNACRECHARADTKPNLLPEIPQTKAADGSPLILTNQQAMHRNCGGCHDEVVKKRPEALAPTSKKCTTCHKKTAA